MTRRPRPTVHGRDHEHGGADPTLIHWEDVGDEGGGTGAVAEAYYTLEYIDAPTTGLRYFDWTYVSALSTGPLLDLADPAHPTLLNGGVYAYGVNLYRNTGVFYAQAGDAATLGFAALGTLINAGVSGRPYQPDEVDPTVYDYINVTGTCVARQDEGGSSFATVQNEMYDNPYSQNFAGIVTVLKLS